MRIEDGQLVRLEDYRPTDFAINHVDMSVALHEGYAEVTTRTSFERRPEAALDAELVLDGDDLTLEGLELDRGPLAPDDFEATPSRLRLRRPLPSAFTLTVRTRLRPEENTQLMGLYRSNGTWCTQCEAEGFRRITYFLDRPDVLATYRVRIEAERTAAPILLANGNPVESGDLGNGRHYAVWDDPFPKPSYLFALVAGDLDVLTDRFTTMSGRGVDLAIYTEKGLAPRAAYAMDAVKRSMVWDERRFGREYDLDVFNIVAISDFNMGAMENKGLNVFNHKYVLLDPETATDADYAGVETVIAHEYFHNWTGNRITCRDWFQLCLKEGLTVYRDQEFTADERSRSVKRIASVQGLKAQQFPEDQGPLQHPVRPTRYREINNFYTATVYEKGAELVRMIATILGEADFRKGMDLYFDRHDGHAATIEDFLACFHEASGEDLSQFALWYAQAGTPTLTVKESFSEGRLTLSLEQALAKGAAGTGTKPMHMPIRFGLVGGNGADMDAAPHAGSVTVEGDVIHMTESVAEVVFADLPERPLVSLLRDFSAPVTLRFDQSQSDRLALARFDPNPFGRWRALSDLVGDELREAGRGARPKGRPSLAPETVEALVASVQDENLEPALRAQMIALPGEGDIARLIGTNVDPEAVHAAREAAVLQFAHAARSILSKVRTNLAGHAKAFSPDAASVGRRSLANALLLPLALLEGSPAPAAFQYDHADNMTDRLSALTVMAHHFPASGVAQAALQSFVDRYENDPLVLDKWFALQATSPALDTLEKVEALAGHPKFKIANPNRARSLIGSFAMANPRVFNRVDGAGYRWVAARLEDLDRLNPQTAARIATAFRSWRSLEPVRQSKVQEALSQLASKPRLSKDLSDILARTLG